jgi:hypothetical protein
MQKWSECRLQTTVQTADCWMEYGVRSRYLYLLLRTYLPNLTLCRPELTVDGRRSDRDSQGCSFTCTPYSVHLPSTSILLHVSNSTPVASSAPKAGLLDCTYSCTEYFGLRTLWPNYRFLAMVTLRMRAGLRQHHRYGTEKPDTFLATDIIYSPRAYRAVCSVRRKEESMEVRSTECMRMACRARYPPSPC